MTYSLMAEIHNEFNRLNFNKYTLMEPARGHISKCPIMHWDLKITWGELVTELKGSTLQLRATLKEFDCVI